ncbi:discoidin domain-containing protein [Actinokineospora sp. NPDC004072]
MREAVRLLTGDGARAWQARLALVGAAAPQAQRGFVRAAIRAYDSAYAAAPLTVSSTLGYVAGHDVALAADGDPDTYYWSAGPATKDSAVTVDLGRLRRVHGVRIALGKPDRPGDYLHQGVLEFSADGRAWYVAARLDRPEHDVRVRADIRYLRLRSTADQAHWLVVRELSVVACKADDGDPSTVFTVTREPVELPLPSSASAVVVRAGADTERGGQVQVRMGGGWRTVGALAGPYTELPLPRGRAPRVRIVPHTPLAVHEVTGRPAG